MDYSMLLCIHDVQKPVPTPLPSYARANLRRQRKTKLRDYDGGIRATDDKNTPLSEVYYLGVIDIMQPFNWRKQVESSLKGFLDNPDVRFRLFHLTFLHKPQTQNQNQLQEISCVEPGKYSKRFQAFLTRKMGAS